MFGRSDKMDAFDGLDGTAQLGNEWTQVSGIENRFPDEALQGFGEADDGMQGLGARSALVFVAAAKKDRVRMQGRADVKGAGPLGTVKLVGANGHQVGIELLNVLKRFFAKPLNGVRVKQDTFSRQMAPSSATG